MVGETGMPVSFFNQSGCCTCRICIHRYPALLRQRCKLLRKPEKNITGQKFWRKTVSGYANGEYEEKLETTVDGPKMVFRFNNGDRQEL